MTEVLDYCLGGPFFDRKFDIYRNWTIISAIWVFLFVFFYFIVVPLWQKQKYMEALSNITTTWDNWSLQRKSSKSCVDILEVGDPYAPSRISFVAEAEKNEKHHSMSTLTENIKMILSFSLQRWCPFTFLTLAGVLIGWLAAPFSSGIGGGGKGCEPSSESPLTQALKGPAAEKFWGLKGRHRVSSSKITRTK